MFVIVCKIDYSFTLLQCVFYGLPGTAFFVLNVADDQIGPICHFPVADLDSRLRVRHRCDSGDLYVGVIVVEVIFVIKILSRRIGQYQNKGAVIVPMIFSYTKHRGRDALIEVPVPSNQKLHILMFVNKLPYLLFQKVLNLYNIIHISVIKKRHRKNVKHIVLYTTLLLIVCTSPIITPIKAVVINRNR